MTSNEIRQVVGLKPSNDPKADQLINSNISQPNAQATPKEAGPGSEQGDMSFGDTPISQLLKEEE